MNYGITIATIGDWPFIPITQEEFQQIKDARIKLLAVLEVEEKFELVENSAEYERDVLDIAQREMLRGDGSWTTVMDDILLLNRRLANLLTAGRLYTDQAEHDVAALYGNDSSAVRDVCVAFSREYDGALEYRVMEALRNHIQHQALPIHNLHYGPERVNVSGRDLVRFALSPELDVAALRASKLRAVLAEIEQNHAARNVTAMVRDFIRGLSRVHTESDG